MIAERKQRKDDPDIPEFPNSELAGRAAKNSAHFWLILKVSEPQTPSPLIRPVIRRNNDCALRGLLFSLLLLPLFSADERADFFHVRHIDLAGFSLAHPSTVFRKVTPAFIEASERHADLPWLTNILKETTEFFPFIANG
jgi:hypothetical protein